MSKLRYLIKNTVLFAIGNIGAKLMVFFLIPVYTLYLTTEEFGITELLQSSINLLIPILTLGLSDAALRFSMEKKSSKKEVLSYSFRVLGYGTVILFACSFLIKDYFPQSLIEIWYWLPILFFFAAGRSVLSHFSRGVGKIKLYVIDSLINSVILVVFTVLFLGALKYGIKGFVLSLILTNLVSFLMLMCVGKLYKYLTIEKISYKTKKEMTHYSLPLVPNSLAWWITNLSDRVFVTYYSGLSVNGIYSLAYKIPSILNLVSGIFIQSWQLSAIKEYDSDDKASFYSDTFKYFVSFIFIIASVLILFNKIFATHLYRNDFYVAWKYVPILIIAFVVSNMHSFLGTIFTAAKQTKQLFISTSVGAIANIVLNILLIPSYEAFGAAIATLISYLVVYILRVVALKNIIYIKIDHMHIILLSSVLCFQAFVQITEIKYSGIINVLLFLVTIFLNRKNILNMLTGVSKVLLKKRST